MSLPAGFYEATHQFGWMLDPASGQYLRGSPFPGDNPTDPNWPVFLRLKEVPRQWGQLPPFNEEIRRLPRSVYYGGPLRRQDVPGWVQVFRTWAASRGNWTVYEVVPIAPEFRGYTWPTQKFVWYTAYETGAPSRYQYVMPFASSSQRGAGWYKVA